MGEASRGGTDKDTSSFHTGSDGAALPSPDSSTLGVDAPLPGLAAAAAFTFLALFVRRAASANARLMEPIPSEGPYELVRGSAGCFVPSAGRAAADGLTGGRETNSFCSN